MLSADAVGLLSAAVAQGALKMAVANTVTKSFFTAYPLRS